MLGRRIGGFVAGLLLYLMNYAFEVALPGRYAYIAAGALLDFSSQLNCQIPPGTAVGLATATTNAQGTVYAVSMELVSDPPGLFSADGTGQGLAAANLLRVKADGSQTYQPPVQPIDLGPEGETANPPIWYA